MLIGDVSRQRNRMAGGWLSGLPEGPVLNAGCGPGVFEDSFPGSFLSRCVSLDLRYGMLAAAKEKHKGSFVQARGQSLPFCREAFSAVLLLDVIEHLPREDASLFLSEAARVLKPGGILVLSYPPYWVTALFFDSSTHRALKTSKIKKLLKGFIIEKVHTSAFFFYYLAKLAAAGGLGKERQWGSLLEKLKEWEFGFDFGIGFNAMIKAVKKA